MAVYHVLSYFALGLSLFFSVTGVAVSAAAICWFFCGIEKEDTGTELDLMKFIYFRSSRCKAKFNWEYLNITNFRGLNPSERELDIADESFASQRTLILLNFYFVINLALIVTAFIAIYGLNRRKGGRHFNYYALCFPWIVMNFIGLALDLVATYLYSSDYFRLLWDFSYILDLIGVKNPSRNLVRFIKVNEDNSLDNAMLATMYTFLTASKLFFPLLVFFVLGILMIKFMWEVVCDNKRIQIRLRRF